MLLPVAFEYVGNIVGLVVSPALVSEGGGVVDVTIIGFLRQNLE